MFYSLVFIETSKNKQHFKQKVNYKLVEYILCSKDNNLFDLIIKIILNTEQTIENSKSKIKYLLDTCCEKYKLENK